ncbi:MAG: YcgN family cysteine cluster protein [Pseudolabrys sp.]
MRLDPKPATAAPPPLPFWRTKRLSEMTRPEWESLCDGCGRCCLNKLEEEGTGRTFFTDVACKLLDAAACRCRDYANRKAKVPDCVKLTWRNVARIAWLPPTCAYRLVAQRRDLYWWHPLVSGSRESVHEAGISVRGRQLHSEADVPDEALERHIVSWPGKVPKASRQRGVKG